VKVINNKSAGNSLFRLDNAVYYPQIYIEMTSFNQFLCLLSTFAYFCCEIESIVFAR
jgi:hypothetical protein